MEYVDYFVRVALTISPYVACLGAGAYLEAKLGAKVKADIAAIKADIAGVKAAAATAEAAAKKAA